MITFEKPFMGLDEMAELISIQTHCLMQYSYLPSIQQMKNTAELAPGFFMEMKSPLDIIKHRFKTGKTGHFMGQNFYIR